jgi:signal peptidase I
MSEQDIFNDDHSVEPQVPENVSSKSNSSQSPISSFIDYVEVFVVALSLVIIIFSFFIRICKVQGPSMENTLYEDEKLIVTNIGYTPKRGDIIVFHQTGTLNEPVVKRVIATAGETVDIDFDDYGKVTITDVDGNEFVLDEIDYKNLDSTYAYIKSDYELPYTVPEGCIFVMGDNRNHSTDSRSLLIGPVDQRRVLGKVILRISPIDRFGKVD